MYEGQDVLVKSKRCQDQGQSVPVFCACEDDPSQGSQSVLEERDQANVFICAVTEQS
jgi:hypothetical protein